MRDAEGFGPLELRELRQTAGYESRFEPRARGSIPIGGNEAGRRSTRNRRLHSRRGTAEVARVLIDLEARPSDTYERTRPPVYPVELLRSEVWEDLRFEARPGADGIGARVVQLIADRYRGRHLCIFGDTVGAADERRKWL